MKNLDDIKNPTVRKRVAEMTLDYWHQCTLAAARAHPNWTVTEDGHLKRLGGRTGPRTPHSFLTGSWRTTPGSATASTSGLGPWRGR